MSIRDSTSSPTNMGRGAYDTTGIPKPPQAEAAISYSKADTRPDTAVSPETTIISRRTPRAMLSDMLSPDTALTIFSFTSIALALSQNIPFFSRIISHGRAFRRLYFIDIFPLLLCTT
ncbi:unnamed protein product [Parascedosporium putredinis]|uniref:Uncharacterized protein n=1 Tax=Parascedosporium putredinis TaxID=1442378 RepID=A0A9P1GVT2_9PEZI|nr:unnamed protein product [Parascedosporium putredinis]CAI7988792.1 unnamed protein product [Parascedosporium putredinis]